MRHQQLVGRTRGQTVHRRLHRQRSRNILRRQIEPRRRPLGVATSTPLNADKSVLFLVGSGGGAAAFLFHKSARARIVDESEGGDDEGEEAEEENVEEDGEGVAVAVGTGGGAAVQATTRSRGLKDRREHN